MSTPLFDNDICANKHGGNPQSVAANQRVDGYKASMRDRIRVFVGATGYHGATLKEFCKCAGVTPNQVSGRFTALKAAGDIWASGRVRDNCAVYVGRMDWANGGAE